MARKKKRPELDLPPILIEVIGKYLGSAMNRLPSSAVQKLVQEAVNLGATVGAIVEDAAMETKPRTKPKAVPKLPEHGTAG